MPIKLTPGKIDGLTAVADERGVIAALALDQRGLLKNMIAMELGEDTSEQDYYCPTSAKVKSPYSCPTPGRGKVAAFTVLDSPHRLPALSGARNLHFGSALQGLRYRPASSWS